MTRPHHMREFVPSPRIRADHTDVDLQQTISSARAQTEASIRDSEEGRFGEFGLRWLLLSIAGICAVSALAIEAPKVLAVLLLVGVVAAALLVRWGNWVLDNTLPF